METGKMKVLFTDIEVSSLEEGIEIGKASGRSYVIALTEEQAKLITKPRPKGDMVVEKNLIFFFPKKE